MKINTKSIVVAAVTIALTVALAPLPVVFMLPLLFTCCTRNMKMSLFMGLAFGVVSYLYSLSGGSVIAVAFAGAPWIPILPRIVVGFVARGVFVISKKLIKSKHKAAVAAPYAFSAACGALTNTALIISLLVLFKGSLSYDDTTIMAFVPIMLIYAAIEFATYIIIVPPLSITVSRALRLNPVAPTTPNTPVQNENHTN